MDQHKALAALTILILIISSHSGNSGFDISVGANGTDVPACINGSVFCRTLHYVLLSLSNATCTVAARSVRIAIYYDHPIVSADYAFQCDVVLNIIGVFDSNDAQTTTATRTLTCDGFSTGGRICIRNALAVYWTSILLRGCTGPDLYGLSHAGYIGCKIEESGGMIVENTGSVNITHSSLSCAQATSIPSDSFISITEASIYLTDVIFIGPRKGGTATLLRVVKSVLYLEGNLMFVNSSGVLGGALRLSESQVVVSPGNVSVLFMDNYAQYGSAVYIDNMSCPFINTDSGFLDITFTQSAAMGSGQSFIYIDNPNNLNSTCLPHPSTYRLSHDPGHTFGRSSPSSMSVIRSNNAAMFPGKYIVVDANITDYFQNDVSCDTYVGMSYANSSYVNCNDPQYQFELVCPFSIPQRLQSIMLSSANGINTSIQIKAEADPETINVSIYFTCKTAGDSLRSLVYFDLLQCPPTYTTFNNVTQTCECIAPLHSTGTFVCSSGTACLAAKHWIGRVASSSGASNLSVVLPCYFPYCSLHPLRSDVSCPLTSSTNGFVLGDDPDDQCSSNGGGLLCRGCRDGYCFTHPPLKCIPRTTEGAAIGIILFSFFLHVIKAVIVIGLLSQQPHDTKRLPSVRSGPLYGALFFLAYIGRLPFGSVTQFQGLQIIVSAFRSLILPSLDILSSIPVCLFPSSSSSALMLTSLRYLSLLALVTVIIIYNVMFCFCPGFANHLHTSPLKSICLLILWVYYLVVTNSIDILKYNRLGGVDHVRVALQPDYPYFGGIHILLGLIAILLMLFFAVPLVSILLLSQLLWKCFDLSKIKPFMDEFQHIYRDNCQWFSSGYLILWMAIVTIPDQTEYVFVIYILLLAAFCILLCLVEPYKEKWLNYVDVAFLVDLLIVTSLFDQQLLQYEESLFTTVLVYVLVTLPLVYFGVGITGSIILRLKCMKCARENKPSESQVQSIDEPLHEATDYKTARMAWKAADYKNYRESLLSEMDEK